ncbi:thiamine pyrophosphate-requiring protein [Spirillospora sp. NPDC048911]|uniref:thiamine pyrophosphate-requiring protein n=1 Tax=Spirillospora sp. NPDC048911 TaxID=3364527 RepID=UPI00371F6E94
MTQVADYVLSRLREWGVHRVYGYPGDGINGFLGAFDRAKNDPEFLQPRHEEMAAFMACGHAKFTDEVGVCMATSGPGAIHLLNGLYDAKLDHVPVVALVGQQRRTSLGADYQQEVDLATLFKDVSEYVQVCMTAAQARHLVDQAMRTAAATRGVATIIFPEDVQEEDAVTAPDRAHGSVFSGVGSYRGQVIPPVDDVRHAAEILNAGEKVAILAGQGARGAAAELVEVADLLGAGVAKALLGRDVLPDDLPFVTGPVGLLGSRASDDMIMKCDTLLMVGTGFPYAEWLPEEGKARVVQIDQDARRIGRRVPVDAGLAGDAREALRLLIPYLERKEDRTWRAGVEADVAEWWRILERQAHQRFDAINPQLVAWELSDRLPGGAILTADSGSGTTWWARQLRLRAGMRASLSGTLATMGPGVPYAIAARFAHPDRPVVAFVGDGAFQMNGMNEMITVARYADRLAGPPLVFCVLNNQDLNMVTWEQRAMGGDPKFPASQDLPDVPYAAYAELLGLTGIRCADPDEVGAAWDRALTADRPVVLEFVVDANVAPMPPHVMSDQAKNTAKALRHDPDRVGATAAAFRQKLAEFFEVRRHG